MAGKVRHLVERSGRYHARLVVPKDLRGAIGKTEIRSPLGGDYRQALRLLPSAVAKLQSEIAVAERTLAKQVGKRFDEDVARYPLTPQQIAISHYTQRLAFDDELRNDRRYASIGLDDLLVSRLRNAVAGRADNEELSSLVGFRVERFRAAGNLFARVGSDEWRVIARALCSAELEALGRVVERDEGDFTGTPSDPFIKDAQPPQDAPKKIKLSVLWSDYIKGRTQAGLMRDKGQRLRPVEASLRKFLKHDDASKVTKKDLIAWREHLMLTLSAKTVNDIYLSAVRSLFSWAVENDRLSDNIASTVRQPKPKKVYGRERGYTNTEAVKLLKASRAYESKADEFGNVREANQTGPVPLSCRSDYSFMRPFVRKPRDFSSRVLSVFCGYYRSHLCS